MIIRRIVRSHHYHTILRLRNPFESSPPLPHWIPSHRPSFSLRPFSFWAQNESTEPITSRDDVKVKRELKKSLSIHFKEAVGLQEKTPDDDETQIEGEDENAAELKEKLKNLEGELRFAERNSKNTEESKEDGIKRVEELFKNLSITSEEGVKRVMEQSEKESSSKRGLSLSSLFASKARRDRDALKEKKELEMDHSDYKPLSPEMEKFVIYLYEKGYFNDSNFLTRNRFDITCFENSYAKDYIRYAAEQFGRDNREIAKWLSGSDLKKVASFGCPSLGKKIVYSAKGLRRFFGIHENTVCNKCILKQSCKFVNLNGWKVDNKYLDLAMVMRVIPQYAMESVPPELVVPEEIKDSVNRLLTEAVNLSDTVTSTP
ncbi:OLC1v1023283C1 [Oldenlandia corymbosa var. corymbosa]|uniref:OLC1v1023283C1 n=1 Tax=Oldenlandia corymbosa var. corymbosa TaxID=529605 RepID=A0AAV1BZM0_OLDCO|nr:OLC1v1023283C1 [Oldenlandia corymbosa var. corymbosa]